MVEFDDDTREKPPKLLDEDTLYCQSGTLLALNFLRVSHEVIRSAGYIDDGDLRRDVNNALDALLTHRLECDKCKEV